MSELLISSFLVSDVCESLISLKSNEPCERIPHFAHQKWATMSDSLRSLIGNERCERIAHQKWANELIAHFLTELLIHSFLDKKQAIRSKIKSAKCNYTDTFHDFYFQCKDNNFILRFTPYFFDGWKIGIYSILKEELCWRYFFTV